MVYVTAIDAEQGIADLLDAVNRESAVIRRENRDVAVVVSPQEYARLRAFDSREFQRFCDRVAEGAAARRLDEDKLGEILSDDK